MKYSSLHRWFFSSGHPVSWVSTLTPLPWIIKVFVTWNKQFCSFLCLNMFYSLSFSRSSLWTSTHMSWMFTSFFLPFSVYFLNSRISGFFVELRWFSFVDLKGLSYQLIFLSFLSSIFFMNLWCWRKHQTLGTPHSFIFELF